MLDSQERILDATAGLLRQGGYAGLTIDQVAGAAGCAKGLVHYHFGTKSVLLDQTVRRIATARDRAWLEALDGPTPDRAVADSWQLLRGDDATAALVAAQSWSAASPDFAETVRGTTRRFAQTLSTGLGAMLEAAGLALTVPNEQIAWLLVSVVHGMAGQLASGTPPEQLEEAYAATWVGILSLTQPS